VSVINRDQRRTRFALWTCIGAIGATIDISITAALLSQTHYLLANLAGFSVAVCLNWAGNWMLTYQRPSGSPLRQWARYVGLHSLTFGGRAAVIAGLVEIGGAPVIAATAAGIGTAVALNFAGTESIFGRAESLASALTDMGNRGAHLVWSSRLRGLMRATGVYKPLFSAYATALGLAYRDERREVRVGGAEATLATEGATETVSVLHTLEAERDVLEHWVDDVRPGDRVLDVGANLGVFSALAGDVGAEVTAVEPHKPTGRRCERNLTRNSVDGRVHQCALGDERGTVGLDMTHDAPGTQRPAVGEGDSVPVVPGDELAIDPTVVKVDVEGHESAVLAGLDETLRESVRVVFVEAHSEAEAVGLTGQLREAGFAVNRLTDGAEVHLRGETDD